MNAKNEIDLEISHSEVEVGGTYPIFGMITKLNKYEEGSVVAEINYNINAKISLKDGTKLEMLRERAFESGIFISTVTSKEPKVEVDCKTIIFGKKQAHNA